MDKPPLNPESLTTQQRVVFDALEAGKTLTNSVAITCYGIGSLSSRVAELRRLGYEITDEIDVDRFQRRYKKYRAPAGETSE